MRIERKAPSHKNDHGVRVLAGLELMKLRDLGHSPDPAPVIRTLFDQSLSGQNNHMKKSPVGSRSAARLVCQDTAAGTAPVSDTGVVAICTLQQLLRSVAFAAVQAKRTSPHDRMHNSNFLGISTLSNIMGSKVSRPTTTSTPSDSNIETTISHVKR